MVTTNTNKEMLGLEAITQVVNELEPKGFLEYYRDDFLLYDAAVLSDFGGAFLWSVRPTGTHLLCKPDQPTDKLFFHEYDKAWESIVSGRYTPEARSYYFDGTELVEITGKPRLVREIMYDWEKGREFCFYEVI
jgi:hypothetical protein